MSICAPICSPALSPAALLASSTSPAARAPTPPRQSPAPSFTPAQSIWSPSPELAQYTALLTQANLEIVQHRTDSLRRLQEFTVDGEGTAIDQLRTCGTIKTLPFLRMSKKVRENRLNSEFVAAGRAFNGELLAAKIAAAKRLSEIARDPQVPSPIQRLASAVNVRSSSGMKVEWGEINDREIPEHLMPPGINEAMWMADLFPAAEVVARTIAIPGDVLVASTTEQDQNAKTPLGRAVVHDVAIPGNVFVASPATTQSPAIPPNPINKKNRFKKRGK